MDNIQNNKAEYLKKQNFSLEITKSKDVLGKDSVRAMDILNAARNDKKVNKMSDIFPRNIQTNSDDDLLS